MHVHETLKESKSSGGNYQPSTFHYHEKPKKKTSFSATKLPFFLMNSRGNAFPLRVRPLLSL